MASKKTENAIVQQLLTKHGLPVLKDTLKVHINKAKTEDDFDALRTLLDIDKYANELMTKPE